MNSIIETNTFSAKAARIWSTDEYETFIAHIANYPLAGKVVQGSGGVRKVRWSARDAGKRSGVRVLYYNTARGETWLLTLYAKNERETILAHELRRIKDAIDG